MFKTVISHIAKALLLVVAVVVASLALAVNASAMPPHPSLVENAEKAAKLGQSSSLPTTQSMHELGICTPDEPAWKAFAAKGGHGAPGALGPFRILALLVDFSDKPAQTDSTFFDSLVFGSGVGTVRDYFDEISGAQIDLVTVNMPSVLGWNRAPQTYAYYVDNQYGMYGTYPQNSQGLVTALVTAVDGSIDFSPYDNDGNGTVDVLLVIHAGTGAELSGNAADMWSHKWAIPEYTTNDGVGVSSFTVQPEFWSTPGDMTIGVYAHELLHGFGLPDLYDIDNGIDNFVSQGIGRWGIMSGGSWNGTLGDSPAHPSAWSRIQLGITTPLNQTTNATQVAIGAVFSGGPILKVWTSGAATNEYYLVENRQRMGYDISLPGEGLLIWHIDDNKTNNRQEWYPSVPGSEHFLVALEQADGLYELEHATSSGDTDDPYPGSGNVTSFNGNTSPSSDGYLSGGSFVAVENISASGALMHADIVVGVAAGIDELSLSVPTEYELAQNYPNPFNPETNIELSLKRAADVDLNIYNVLGQHVKSLADGYLDAGTTTLIWDGTNESDRAVSSGTYFYRLVVDDSEEETRKMILVR